MLFCLPRRLPFFLISVDSQYGHCTVYDLNSSLHYATPIYLFLVSQGELIWYVEWLKQANVAAFEPAIANFLTAINTEPQRRSATPTLYQL